jgi:hypothetical protein
MSEHTYSARIERRDALGRAAGNGEIRGELDYVLDNVRLHVEVLRELHPGDSLVVTIECEVPGDHPLAGIDLEGRGFADATGLRAADRLGRSPWRRPGEGDECEILTGRVNERGNTWCRTCEQYVPFRQRRDAGLDVVTDLACPRER